MADYTSTPNMAMNIPIVSQTTGPVYATYVNAAFTTIDTHDHSSGKGVLITPGGLNINADLTFNSNDAIALRTSRYTSQISTLSGSASQDIQCIYVSGVDLYYNDGNGNTVRITNGGSVTGAAGTITGMTGSVSAVYTSGNATFTFQSATNVAANLDGRNIILRNAAANSKGLTLSPPAAMAADIAMTFPTLPAASAFMVMDTSGNMTSPSQRDYINAEYLNTSAVGDLVNCGLSCVSSGSNNWVLSLKTNSDGNPSVTDPIQIKFKNVGSGSAGFGTPIIRKITVPTSLTITSSSSFGTVSGVSQELFVYAIDNSGTVVLGISGAWWNDDAMASSSPIGIAGSTSRTIIYTTPTIVSTRAIKLIGRIVTAQATAGQWVSRPVDVTVGTINKPTAQAFTTLGLTLPNNKSEVQLQGSVGNGSVGNRARVFTSVVVNTGVAITYNSDATNGDSFTINEAGVYTIGLTTCGTSPQTVGVTRNTAATTAFNSGAVNDMLTFFNSTGGTNSSATCAWTGFLTSGDVIRAQTEGTDCGASTSQKFYIIKIL